MVKTRLLSSEATAEVVREVFGCAESTMLKWPALPYPIIKANPIILLILSPMSAVVFPVAEARDLFQEKRYTAETLMTDQTAELMN
ncbi:MAG: hypothetical protein ABL921_29735 [Pirellula sp.]